MFTLCKLRQSLSPKQGTEQGSKSFYHSITLVELKPCLYNLLYCQPFSKVASKYP